MEPLPAGHSDLPVGQNEFCRAIFGGERELVFNGESSGRALTLSTTSRSAADGAMGGL